MRGLAEGKEQRLTIKMITFDDIENVVSSIFRAATERGRRGGWKMARSGG
jgi:hypothetical protein